MWSTKIIAHNSNEKKIINALPKNFQGYITLEKDIRPNIQVWIIHHTTCVNPMTVYENLGIELHEYLLLPRFLFK